MPCGIGNIEGNRVDTQTEKCENKVERKMMAKAQRCASGQRNKYLDLRGKWGIDKGSGLSIISRHMPAATNTFFTKRARSHEARHDDMGAQLYQESGSPSQPSRRNSSLMAIYLKLVVETASVHYL